MGNPLQLAFLTLVALSCFVEGRVFSSSNSGNKHDTADLCASIADEAVSCADVNSVDGLTAHPGDCRLFYQCVSPAAAPVCRHCPPALHFNPALRVCDLPDRAGCASEQTTTTGHSLPNDDIPERCLNNSITIVSCANETSPDALLPHPDDCELFYYCVNPESKPVCRQCSAGLHFNPLLHVCDKPEDAECRSISSIPDRGDVSEVDDGDEIPERCVEKSVTPVSCEARRNDSLVAHPDDCELFYSCVSPESRPVCRLCPARLHFNPELWVCDLPQRAGCRVTTDVHILFA